MKNILVLTWWEFDDALIQAYTLPYVRIIRDVLKKNKGGTIYLLTLEKNKSEEGEFPLEEGIVQLRMNYVPLSASGILKWKKRISQLSSFCRSKKITHLHSWCAMPGGIACLLKKKTGLPHIADSYEPHADPMVESGTWKKGSFSYRLLYRWEKLFSKHADVLIANSPLMQQYVQSRYSISRKIDYVKPACVDPDLFSLNKRKDERLLDELGFRDKKVIVYAGKFGGLYYKKETFRLFRAFCDRWKDDLRILLLTAHPKEEIIALANENGIPFEQFAIRFVPHAEVPRYIGLGDVGLCPIIPTPSRIACSPIKNGEYWAMGMPILVCKGVSIDNRLVNEYDAGYVLNAMTAVEFAKAVEQIDSLWTKNKEEVIQRMRSVSVTHRNFGIAKNIYEKIYGGNG